MSIDILGVIDVQGDFVYTRLATKESQSIIPNIRRKIQKYCAEGKYIVYTQDTHSSDYLSTQEGRRLQIEHCVAGTNGWKIVTPIPVTENLQNSKVKFSVIEKHTFGFINWKEELDKLTNGKIPDSIELIGLCTDICVVSNALILKALYPETRIIIDASCCAGTTPENHQAALQVMRACQIDIVGE